MRRARISPANKQRETASFMAAFVILIKNAADLEKFDARILPMKIEKRAYSKVLGSKLVRKTACS